MNNVDEFFDGLPSEDKKEADIFAEEAKVAPKIDDDPEQAPESIKDRRHRRLEQKLQAERESNIALNARINALSETDRFRQEIKTEDIPIDWLSIYGGATPEGQEQAKRAWKLQQEMLSNVKEEAKKEALEEIENRQQETAKQQKQFESFIDTELESIEDQYNVDVTSNAPSARKARREFLELVQKFSPKDEDGTITDYADFGATWEAYQATAKKPDNSRQKDLADRSMKQSGDSGEQPKAITPGFQGWRRDYNL